MQVVEPKVLHRSWRFRSDSSKQRTTRRAIVNRELIYIYKLIYLRSDLPVGPPRTHYIQHNIHDTCICQLFDSQNVKSVKSLTLLRLKTHFSSQGNPGNLIQNFKKHILRCATTSQKKITAILASSGLAGQPHKCSLFLFPDP